MKHLIKCLLIFYIFSLTILFPHAKASGVVDPGSDIGSLYVGSDATLIFGATYSTNTTQSIAIILVNYSVTGFSYNGFMVDMDGTNISGQFVETHDPGFLTLQCNSIMPVNGTLSIGVSFEAVAEGNYTFSWRHIFVAYPEPPNIPFTVDVEGETRAETVPNVDPSVVWLWANDQDLNARLDPGGEVEKGHTVRMLSRVSDPETASSALSVNISYRPQGGSWAIEEASFNASGDHWYIDWTIPGDAASGLYDTRVEVWDPDGGFNTSTELGEFNVTALPPPPPPPPSPPPFFPPATVNEIPIANAGADQTVFRDRTLYLDGLKSNDPDGEITNYLWILGDGSTKQGETISHSYSIAGTYNVELIVIDNLGATNNDTLVVTVIEPPLNHTTGVDEFIEANQTDYEITSIETTNISLKINTTDSVTISILKYSANPYPEVPLPPNTLSAIVDIAVSNLEAIQWPIHVERHYSDTEINGLNESKLIMYYYHDGAWHKCQNTGVYPEENIVWANMYKHELSGSPTTIGQNFLPATFMLSNLTVNPANIESGNIVTVSITVRNIGDVPGSYTLNLKINGVIAETETLHLNEHSDTQLSFDVKKETTGSHIVEVGDLSTNFTVSLPPNPAELKVSSLIISPTLIESGKTITATVQLENIGGETGDFNLTCIVDGIIEVTQSITLDAQETSIETFNIVKSDVGIHNVEINGLSGTFTVVAPPKPAEFVVSDLELSPTNVEVDRSVTISLTLTNIGEETGSYDVEINIDDSLAYTRQVTLDGGAFTIVTFTAVSGEEGTHTVESDGHVRVFTVSGLPDETVETFTDTQKVIGISIILVIIVSASIYYYNSRKP